MPLHVCGPVCWPVCWPVGLPVGGHMGLVLSMDYNYKTIDDNNEQFNIG